MTDNAPAAPRSRALRLLRSRPRLWLAIAVGVIAWAALRPIEPLATVRELVAWNLFAITYLVLAYRFAAGATPQSMGVQAARYHEGRAFVLLLVVIAAAAVLFAIGSQLATVKDMHGLQKTRHVALAAITVVSAWLFTQTLFALEYAHDFYVGRLRKRADSLVFPGTPDPTYGDFLYFSCVIGTSAQTADVSFAGSALRRVGLVHCVLAFFFNTTVLALTINIAAGLF